MLPGIMRRFTSIPLAMLVFATSLTAQPEEPNAPVATVTIDGTAAGRPMPATLFGIFFEETNRAGDGGLYAEILENRSFEDNPDTPVCWDLTDGAVAALDRARPLNANNPTALRLDSPGSVVNRGFKGQGISARQNEALHVACRARSEVPVTLTIQLLSNDGRLSPDHLRSMGWKSGLRVNLFGGKTTVAFGNWGNQVHSLEGINTSLRTPSA